MHSTRDICSDYKQLIDKFINGSLLVDEFQHIYLDKFKNEKRYLNKTLHELLEDIFGDIDSFTLDPELHAERPYFYLNESRLRNKMKKASSLLLTMMN